MKRPARVNAMMAEINRQLATGHATEKEAIEALLCSLCERLAQAGLEPEPAVEFFRVMMESAHTAHLAAEAARLH